METINISLYNNGLTPLDIKTDINNSQNFLDKASNYECAIMKLNIPSSNLQTFKISNKSDYAIRMLTYNDASLGAVKNLCYNLPNDVDDLVSNVTYGSVTYFNEQQILDSVNRTLYRLYIDTVKLFQPTSIPSSFTTANLTNTSKSAIFTFIPIVSPVSRCSGIEFCLGGISGTILNNPFNIVLTSPSGQSMIIHHGNPSQFSYSQISSSQVLTFSDGSFNELQPNQVLNRPNTFVIPSESFLNLSTKTTQVNGNWTISLSSDSPVSWTASLSYKLTVLYDPLISISSTRTFPNLSPTFSFDANNKLVFNYQENYRQNNIKFSFSPKLKNILNLGNNNYKFNTSTNDYEFIYPSYNYSNNPDNIFSLPQQISTKYLFRNIDRIILTSTLPIQSEFFNSTNLQSDILQDFLIDSTSDLDILDFSPDISVIPARRYKLNSQAPLRNFSISARVVYKDNQTQTYQMYLNSGESMYCRITFFPINN